MKRVIILSMLFVGFAFAGVSQDVEQISGLKYFKGDKTEWLMSKDGVTSPQKGFILLRIDHDILILPQKLKDDSEKIVSEFLSSGHTTGIKSDVYTIFGWNIEQGSALKLGQSKGVIEYQDGDD